MGAACPGSRTANALGEKNPAAVTSFGKLIAVRRCASTGAGAAAKLLSENRLITRAAFPCEKPHVTHSQSAQKTYYTSIEVENVRCFGTRQRLDLTGPDGAPARWTLLLGENGVGKTTLLQCLAWMRPVPGQNPARIGPALLNEENDVLETLPRLGAAGPVSLHATLTTRAGVQRPIVGSRSKLAAKADLVTSVTLEFDHEGLQDVRPRSSSPKSTVGRQFDPPLIVAYGASRQLGRSNLAAGELVDPIASRLAGHTELYDVEEILTYLDYAALKQGDDSRERHARDRFLETLARMLPGEQHADVIEIKAPNVLGRGEPGGPHVRMFDAWISLSKLSLGYQSTLAWTSDLAWRLSLQYPTSMNPLAEPAVVLIDEIDLHLHPRWQLVIIDKLSALFPGTQFVATAHSPLLVQVAEEANLVLLRPHTSDGTLAREVELDATHGSGAGIEIVNDPEVVRGWRVDQILTSELFGIRESRGPTAEARFQRRADLLDKKALSASEHRELQRIQTELAALPTAASAEDEEAMDFLRRAAAVLKRHNIATA